MSKETLDLNNLNEKLEKNSKEINSFKKELNSIKQINKKTKELLLLELESNLDKQKQIQINQDIKVDSFKEIINLLKEENNNYINELSSLNEKVGKFKQSIDDKNKKIKDFSCFELFLITHTFQTLYNFP